MTVTNFSPESAHGSYLLGPGLEEEGGEEELLEEDEIFTETPGQTRAMRALVSLKTAFVVLFVLCLDIFRRFLLLCCK